MNRDLHAEQIQQLLFQQVKQSLAPHVFMAEAEAELLDISNDIVWGEAYHNNHHHNPGKANNSHKWFEFDGVYFIVKILNRLRIVHL